MNKKILIITLAVIFRLNSQTYNYLTSIGNFNTATSISISTIGYIYVTDAGTDEVYKLDTLGNRIKDVGGHGWDDSNFDIPSDVFATPIKVFVSDKNNHRIQQFDKDLVYISQTSTRDGTNPDAAFGYPLGCVSSNLGDLFILDSENKRVVKFDVFGNYSLNFGGFDAGNFSVHNPRRLAISPDNKIFVLDSKSLIIFDNFGNGLINQPLSDNFHCINIMFNKITLTSQSYVLAADFSGNQLRFEKIILNGDYPNNNFIASIIFKNNLYILTASQILIFTQQ
jgi:DNA-binding beta-propeller fold protein YncE